MRLLLAALAPLALAPHPVPAQGAGAWEVVGVRGFSAAHVTSCRIAFDSQDVPYVAYQDLALGTAATSVKRFVGGAWEHVGPQGGASQTTAWYNQMAFDSQDALYVATRDYGYGGHINVRRFPAGGTSWSNVGVAGFSPGEAHYTAFAIGPDDTPYVVFADRETNPVDRATAMAFTNGSWSFLGAPGLSPANAGFPSIAVADEGTAYVAYMDTSLADRGSVMRFDAATATWSPLGPQGFTGPGAGNLTIALDRSGAPWVAYHQWHQRIAVHRWNGTEWPLVLSSASRSDAPDVQTESWRQWLSLAFDSQNAPYVAYQMWHDGLRATVRRFDGTSWNTVGPGSFTPAAADYMALAIDSRDVPHVVFRDGSAGGGVTVMRYAPSPWTYCAAKTSSQGCTPQIYASGQPSASSGQPYVVGASSVDAQRPGMLLYAFEPASRPFLGGTLCLAPPILRAGAQFSDGTPGTCEGAFAFDLGPLLQQNPAAAPGEMAFAQYWYRDPPDRWHVGLSDAVRATIGP